MNLESVATTRPRPSSEGEDDRGLGRAESISGSAGAGRNDVDRNVLANGFQNTSRT